MNPVGGRRHTLLVVDDEPDVVKSVQDLLRLEYQVLGATRPAEGLRILRENPVDIVMADQRMPVQSGVEFLARVRQEHPDIVRLLFTGYADITAVIDAINQGNVYRYIAKPWDAKELQSVLRQAAERHDLLVERKRLIEELQAANQELAVANTQLKQASELKSSFIQVASHELRTPLTIVLGLSELALEGDPGPPLRGFLERIQRSSERLQRLITQMMTVLAADRFEVALDRRPTEVGRLVQEALEDIRPFAELRRQQLQTEGVGEVGTVVVDGEKIRDSLNHLLINAVKFTPDGGTITVAARRGADQSAQIVVRDSGVGIDPESLPHLFKPFFTGFNAKHHSSGQFEFGARGLGLGLSLVKAFVELHGGRVEAQSELGRGSTFTVFLPGAADGRDGG